MTYISHHSPTGAAGSEPGSPGAGAEPPLQDLFGLLVVRQDTKPDEQGSAQLETVLRMLNGTQVGANLLRAIQVCDIAADQRPAILFEYDDEGDSIDEGGPPSGAAVIRFDVVRSRSAMDSPSHDSDPEAWVCSEHESLLNRTIHLFMELTAFYARHTNQPSPQPYLGFGDYSTLTLREQLGDPVPQWQREVEAYIREAAPDEDRARVWDAINAWRLASDPQQALRLNSMGLTVCPPLRNLPGLERLELVDNRLAAFPPADRLPPAITAIDLAGNPIRSPADSHGANLRSVTLDRTVANDPGLRAALPANVAVIQAEPDYVRHVRDASRFMTEFPDFSLGILDIEAFEQAGFSNDVMAPLYPRDMLTSAVAKWLPAPNDAWRRAQQDDPNGAAALSALIQRLHGAWNPHKDPVFHERFVALLSKMQRPGNEEFMDDCMTVARDGAASCDDRILHTINNLHVASLNADARAGHYDNRLVELMHLGEDMLNLRTLTQYFATIRPELQRRAREKDVYFDEVEQFLHLQTLLQGRAHLPAMQFKMQFGDLSVVTDDDAEAARVRIAQARDTDFIDFLASWSPLQSVIARTAPRLVKRADKWRDHIYNDRGGVYGLLDRLLNAEGRLFVSNQQHGMEVFNVGPRMFWTRYERLVDRQLATHGLTRDMPDVLPQACTAVSKTIDALIQRTTTREFLAMRKLKLLEGIQNATPPRWFKRLRKDVS